MIKKILVPSGIGDFSWTWSKLVTTGDQYEVDYVGGTPDRMKAYLNLLPKDKIVKFKANPNYATKWDEENRLVGFPREKSPYIVNVKSYAELNEVEMKYIECNSLLESGVRLEQWLIDEIPNTDFHYMMDGVLSHCAKNNYFIVNFSSYGTKKAWGYYEAPETIKLVKFICKKTGFMPIFIGGTYDDYTTDICRAIIKENIPAIDLVGKTPELIGSVRLIQQSRFYFGACSGLMALANVMFIPTLVYYPPFPKPPGRKLSGTWHDPNVLHVGLFWEGRENDMVCLEPALDGIIKESSNRVYSYR